MNHLIIYAHPNTNSFCNAIKHTIADKLEEQLITCHIRDLYTMQFNPVLSYEDMGKIYSGDTSIDILVEQDMLRQADILHVIYPLWWTGFPAILKGYFDRVLHYGFGYAKIDGEIKGLLPGKKVILYTTQGHPKEYYDKIGMTQALHMTSDVGVFNFCGMEVLHHHYFGSVPSSSKEYREEVLNELKKNTPEFV